MNNIVNVAEPCTFHYRDVFSNKEIQYTGLYSLPGSQSRAVQVAMGAFGRTLVAIVYGLHNIWQREKGSCLEKISMAQEGVQFTIVQGLGVSREVTAEQFLETTQAQLEDYRPLAARVGEIVRSYFHPKNEQHYAPLCADTERTFDSMRVVYTEKFFVPLEVLAYQALGIRLYSTAGQEEQWVSNPIDCTQYALLQVGDPIVQNRALFSVVADVAFAVHHIELHYTLVQEGSPKTGDLVVYFVREEDGAYKPQHCGVWTEDGAVISKFGTVSPHIYRHGLFDVEQTYGQYAVFFRKKESQNTSAQA